MAQLQSVIEYLDELHQENQNLKRAMGILWNASHIEDSDGRTYNNGIRHNSDDSDWLSQFLKQDNE